MRSAGNCERQRSPAYASRICLLFSGLMLLFCLACSGDRDNTTAGGTRYPYYDPFVPGPYRAGFSQQSVFDAARDRALPLNIWYPISPDAEGDAVRYFGILPGDALKGGRIETRGAPFPLVVFSHGSGSVSIQNYPNCEYLATHGYIVAAPSHIGNTLFTGDPELLGDMLEIRPCDIEAVLDWILASEYGASIDPEAIGMMGHSYGAYTSIAVAGAEAHPARYNAFCSDPEAENEGCELTGIFPETVESVDFGDARVKAVLPISPGFFEIWEADGLAVPVVPVMIMSGTRDELTPHEREAMRLYQGFRAKKYLVTFESANHYGFTILCGLFPNLPPYCVGNLLDPDIIESGVSILSTAFFGLYLKRNPAYGEALQPGNVNGLPGIYVEFAR